MIARTVVWLIWLLSVGSLYFFENNTATRFLLLASVLVPAFSIGWAAVVSRRISCRLEVPAGVLRGGEIPCTLRINTAWGLIGCCAECTHTAQSLLSGAETTLSSEIKGKETVFRIPAQHAGGLLASVERIIVSDWFGIAGFSARAVERKRISVEPRLYPVNVEAGADASRNTEQPRLRSASGEPDAGVRDYVPGDPVRLMHWKLAAKTDKLLIRETSGLEEERAILLDTDQQQDADAMDCAAETFLSVSRACLDAGIPHTAWWTEGPDGDLKGFSILTEEDFRILLEEFDSLQGQNGGEGIADRFARLGGDASMGQILLFTASGHPDASPLTDLARVTVVTPRLQMMPDGRQTLPLTPENAELEW